ncbi:hypothetical protein [Streptomyces lavenduligriseus]|nr:hypothetical protein [Streptomyces lavenduligriseus]
MPELKSGSPDAELLCRCKDRTRTATLRMLDGYGVRLRGINRR